MSYPLFLNIDVGGTKLEYNIVSLSPEGCELIYEGHLFCAKYSSFKDALIWVLEQTSSTAQVSHVCIAAAGPVYNGSISFTNLDWHIDVNDIRARFGFKNLILVNDLTAVMWSLSSLRQQDSLAIKTGQPREGTRLVVAPGTGLGVGFGVETPSGLVTLPSEGGHVSFSPRNDIEMELLYFLRQDNLHISAESVCSGLGLGTIFSFISRDNPCGEELDYHGLGPWLQHQVDTNGSYSQEARKTYRLFFDILAEVCGNLAVTCLPGAGVYLAGGLMARLASFMDKERFVARFLDRSVQQDLLVAMPIYQILHANPALLGCERLLQAGELKQG